MTTAHKVRENSSDNEKEDSMTKESPLPPKLIYADQSNLQRNSDALKKCNNDKESVIAKLDAEILFYWKAVNVLIGCLFLLIISYSYSVYISSLLENNLWFSNIKPIEREISFRTEVGLYYSYYKQLVNARSITQGLEDLRVDNMTESGHTINILARFNIYQEVFLATLYRTIPFIQDFQEPIYFYLNSIFALHGILVAALYCLSWQLSGSWLSGVLTSVYYIINKGHMTRVSYATGLRENFSLPFLWLQILLVSCYFRKQSMSRFTKKWLEASITVCTFLFALQWQFNQFILLMQCFALFAMQILDLVPTSKISQVYWSHITALLAVSILQFGNTMILGGVVISFIPAAFVIMCLQKHIGIVSGFLKRTFCTIMYIILVFIPFFAINQIVQYILGINADDHIIKFVRHKLGILNERDFDVQLYLCSGSFTMIDFETIVFTTNRLLFPPYFLTHVIGIALLIISFIQISSPQPEVEISDQKCTGAGDGKKHKTSNEMIGNTGTTPDHVFRDRPDLAFHLIQSFFFGIVAISTLRMKYLWTPYMCILAPVGLTERSFWKPIIDKFKNPPTNALPALRSSILISVLLAVLYLGLQDLMDELYELREFYDPETVDLMEWIIKSTPATSTFAGTMQLIAGVKLCTGRAITNHPHYEDQALRHRTKEIYQIYGCQPPEVVHKILKNYQTTHIILEDSQCYAGGNAGCRLIDIIDESNGHLPIGVDHRSNLVKTNVPRFCEAIHLNNKEYGRYFKKVFSNPKFHVYRVLEGPTDSQ